MRIASPLRLLVVALPLLAAGCRPAYMRRSDPASQPAPTPAPAPAQNTPIVVQMDRVADPQVAALALLVNNVDINYAAFALARATSPDVGTFARRMLADHTALRSTLDDLIRQMNVTATDGQFVDAMRQTNRSRHDQLHDAHAGAEFDAAYASIEVRSHRDMLELIEGLMIPSTANADLRHYLESLRPAERAHLAAAEQLLSTLPRTP